MRNLFIIALLLLGAFMAGWFKVNRDGDRTTIEINRNEIRTDANKAIDRGRELLHQHEQGEGGIFPNQNEGAHQWIPEQVTSRAEEWAEGVVQSGYQAPAQQQPVPTQPAAQPANNWQNQPTPYQQPYSR